VHETSIDRNSISVGFPDGSSGRIAGSLDFILDNLRTVFSLARYCLGISVLWIGIIDFLVSAYH
jgi:hypothetical protein